MKQSSNKTSAQQLNDIAHQLAANAYSVGEDLANSITHGVGAILSVVALVLMVVLAVTQSSVIGVVSASIYGASMVLLFLASTLYHSFQKPSIKSVLKILDHCAIYILIAGTYTPFMLISLQGAWGYSMTAIIWSLALFGIFFKIFYRHRFPKLSLFTYIAMGWLIIVASTEMVAKVPLGGLVLLAAGGLVYTLGTIFYVWEKFPYNHAVWHVFVLGGATCHFFSIYLYVI